MLSLFLCHLHILNDLLHVFSLVRITLDINVDLPFLTSSTPASTASKEITVISPSTPAVFPASLMASRATKSHVIVL